MHKIMHTIKLRNIVNANIINFSYFYLVYNASLYMFGALDFPLSLLYNEL